MNFNLWSSDVLKIIQKGIDTAALRQKVIANNVANINTPGFKRSEVTFEENLKKALQEKSTPSQGITLGEVTPRVIRDGRTTMRNDLNNVDLDIEMLNLSSNQIKYNGLVQLLSDRYSTMRYIINEGRR
ncbi:MAG: flagellar basal body rod protein FlgB [Firmicutes bacterium HGW-Firmicutes-13]|nr:MAG: flagellar basal body rod protein FlgB [Firmicutes bacterium HGW-Firmicutes-13]